MDRLYSVWNIVRRYKYVAAILLFLLIIGVIDENSWWVRHQRRAEIALLEEQIHNYEQQYDEYTKVLESLTNDQDAVERMAREKYYMKRQNEDVFVFVTTDDYEIQKPLEKPSDHRLLLPGEEAAPQQSPDGPQSQVNQQSQDPQQSQGGQQQSQTQQTVNETAH
ncbi:MAG: septum formation initiator family protein [Bacteroidaceae bacterium]|nr:septum formation initiator family protein [Bacteroidaceae bacterium]